MPSGNGGVSNASGMDRGRTLPFIDCRGQFPRLRGFLDEAADIANQIRFFQLGASRLGEVVVEVNAPGFEQTIDHHVGLPDASVKESSQRVTFAITSSALFLADGIKVVNLAPADLKKEGPSFDVNPRRLIVFASLCGPN